MFLSRGDSDLGVAFQTHQGIQASSRVEAKNSALLLSETGMSGNFLGRINGAKYRFDLQIGRGTSPETL